MIHPISKHLIAIPDPLNQEKKTASGIIINVHHKGREGMDVNIRWGTLVEAHKDCKLNLKAGTRIAYNPFDEYEFEYEGKLYTVMNVLGLRLYEL